MYEVVLARPAQRFYEACDAALQRRLDGAFELLATDPTTHANTRALRGPLSGFYRFRLGDYRVIFRIEPASKRVVVATIAHRSQAYR